MRDSRKLKAIDFAEAMATTVQQLRRLEVGERKLTIEWMDRAVAAFKSLGHTDIERWMLLPEAQKLSAIPSPIVEISGINVIGEVEAGVWREAVQWDDADVYQIPCAVPDKYAGKAYGLRINGDSMNLSYPEGTIVIVVSIYNYDGEISSGKRVIVERCLKNGVCEATAKELEIINGHAKLWPRSTNPKYQEPIDIAWPYETPQEIGLETVIIKGVIIGSYRSEE